MAGPRRSRWARGFLVAIAVVGLLVVGFALAGSAMVAEHPALEPLVLGDGDVPSGYVADLTTSGVLDGTQRQVAGLSAEMAALATGYRRVWRDTASGGVIQVVGFDLGTEGHVAQLLDEFRQKSSEQGYPVSSVPDVSDSVRVAVPLDPSTGLAVSTVGAFGRGPLVFLVTVAQPSPDESAGPGLPDEITASQAGRVGAQYEGADAAPYDPAQAAGGAMGGAVAYLLLVGGWARVRDPLRRRRGGSAWPTVQAQPDAVVDVGARARTLRRRAGAIFAVELAGLTLAASAFLPNDLGTRLALAAGGIALWVAVATYHAVHTTGQLSWSGGSGRGRRRAVIWNGVAALCLVVGLATLAAAPLSGGSGEGQIALASGCFLAAAGLARRWARRISAAEAHVALTRDARPMVLFLRSFGDDERHIRTATLGRRSLVEKLSPSRFDSFEEVLVRHLSVIGPVVAINPPGTSLAPLGAARATMPPDAWRANVDEWLVRARLVVIAAPPEHLTEGLLWELQQVVDRAMWGRVIVVVPPVGNEEAHRRWSELAKAPIENWPFRAPLPVDPARVLGLRWVDEHWVAAAASHRTEWTYAAALESLAGPSMPSETDRGHASQN